jgi:hypothetical protein
MLKKELVFFSAIILMGFLDWLTTVTGVLFLGATEVNPLFSELTKSSMIIFSVVKLSTIVIVGLAFYVASAISRSTSNAGHFTRRFLNGGYSLTFLTLTTVVANNMVAVFRL